MSTASDGVESERARSRYERIAWSYDASELLIEWLVFKRWRRRLWSMIPQGIGLEVGVGTGKNIRYYPAGADVTAVDLSPKMLRRARRRSPPEDARVGLIERDAERLQFQQDTFDWAVATFVYCSVPDPVRGLRELGRVVKPEGRIFLVEHVRIDRTVVGRLMDLSNPVAVRVTGANINRQTVKNVLASGLELESVTDLAPLGLVKLIVACPS